MLPQWENSQPVLHAAHGTGNWIGAASALVHDEGYSGRSVEVQANYS
jgi:hypothetical protein